MIIETKNLILQKNLRITKVKNMENVPYFYKEVFKKVINELNDALTSIASYSDSAKNLAYIEVYNVLFPKLKDDFERKEFLKNIIMKTIISEEIRNTSLKALEDNTLEEASKIINNIVKLSDVRYISLYSEVINNDELKELFNFHFNAINIKLDDFNEDLKNAQNEIDSLEKGSKEFFEETIRIKGLENLNYTKFFDKMN